MLVGCKKFGKKGHPQKGVAIRTEILNKEL